MKELDELLQRAEALQDLCDQARDNVRAHLSSMAVWVGAWILLAALSGLWVVLVGALGALTLLRPLRTERTRSRTLEHMLARFVALADQTLDAAMYLGDLSTLEIAWYRIRRSRLHPEPWAVEFVRVFGP